MKNSESIQENKDGVKGEITIRGNAQQLLKIKNILDELSIEYSVSNETLTSGIIEKAKKENIQVNSSKINITLDFFLLLLGFVLVIFPFIQLEYGFRNSLDTLSVISGSVIIFLLLFQYLFKIWTKK